MPESTDSRSVFSTSSRAFEVRALFRTRITTKLIYTVIYPLWFASTLLFKKLKSCQSHGASCATPPIDKSIMSAIVASATTATPISYELVAPHSSGAGSKSLPCTSGAVELIFACGIPFWHHDGRLFYYDPRTPCTSSDADCLGAYDKATGRCTLLDASELRSALEPRLATWRATLEPSERGKPIAPATKPSRARRTTAKSAKSSSSASS